MFAWTETKRRAKFLQSIIDTNSTTNLAHGHDIMGQHQSNPRSLPTVVPPHPSPHVHFQPPCGPNFHPYLPPPGFPSYPVSLPTNILSALPSQNVNCNPHFCFVSRCIPKHSYAFLCSHKAPKVQTPLGLGWFYQQMALLQTENGNSMSGIQHDIPNKCKGNKSTGGVTFQEICQSPTCGCSSYSHGRFSR